MNKRMKDDVFAALYPLACEYLGGEPAIMKEAERARVAETELEQRLRAALQIANERGGIDGAHHKAWVIDQMVRALSGDNYAEFVREFEMGEDGRSSYRWDVGIAP